ncbi:TonB-dependent receptor plug domain-containing protein [Saccharicrinis sp. FJH62]|uniref:TonB-dependent receptor plug domain-containing protein n=1 Tax=Saccharicrinis sp. FJH62 TaxID=3344657 RepID=UPI0035D3E6EE
MKKHHLAVALLLLFINGLHAENLKDTIKINEVVVTGSKKEVSRKLVPLSVSQISNEEIENTGEINILPTLSTYSPGIFVTERNILGFGVSSGGAGAISIRGVSGTPNTDVLVLIDGDPQYQGIFGHPLPDAYVASDVKKVEIIRGPGSILYGSNAMAGVVNIITKQQNDEGFKSNLGASYGSYNTKKLYGTLGYKKDKLSVFASVNHDQTDGVRENSDFKIFNSYLKLGYQINKHFNLTADLNMAKFIAHDSIYGGEPELFGIDILRGKAAVSLENKFDKSEGAIKLFNNFGTHNLSDGWYSTDRNSGLMIYQTFKAFKGSSITVGIDAKQYGGKANMGMARDSLILITEVAGYAYVQQSICKKLSLTAGLRIENNSDYGNELVPMAGLTYNPGSNTSLKASVSKGFRSPTMMEMYLFAPNQDLKPEKLFNYDITWIQQYREGKLNTELTLFLVNAKNMIQTANYVRSNSGSFTNNGIEFAINYRAAKNLHLHGNYSYLNLSKPLLAAPEHQFNVSANYGYKIFNVNISTQHIQNLYTSLNPDIKQSYTLLNMRIQAQVQKNTSVFVMANNLLNQKYEINYRYPMPEINFSAGIKLIL